MILTDDILRQMQEDVHRKMFVKRCTGCGFEGQAEDCPKCDKKTEFAGDFSRGYLHGQYNLLITLRKEMQ